MPNSFIIVMLDGKNFSKMVKNTFKKPFDDDFIRMMNETAKYLCEEIQGCKIGYTQSDEISLLLSDIGGEDLFFGGRLCKMQSVIASMATAKFNRMMTEYFLKKGKKMEEIPLYNFDCKVWVVPNKDDAFAWFLYRQNDCEKNSRQQFAQTFAEHRDLMKRTAAEQTEFVKENFGKDWDKIENGKKWGRLISKEAITGKKYVEAFKQEIVYERTSWVIRDCEPFGGKKEEFCGKARV